MTVAVLYVDEEPLATFAPGDEIRSESREAVQLLRRMHLRVAMLTGNNRAVATWAGREFGVDQFAAEALPHEQQEVVH